ncbi:MAG: hypothetical protein ABSE48_07055 [Verrucomicrobiota bacterium]
MGTLSATVMVVREQALGQRLPAGVGRAPETDVLTPKPLGGMVCAGFNHSGLE